MPTISCLCVTRGDRPALLRRAIGDFARQSFPDRELLVLHDGDARAAAAVEQAVAAVPCGSPIRIERVTPGARLGGLRNQAVARAAGKWICQWDDDDRYHPERLAVQWADMQARGAAIGYLSDQLHLFVQEGLLFWDDWDREIYPMNLIHGTILARRDVMPAYPDVARAEDTAHTHAVLARSAREGFTVSRLRWAGWSVVYTVHGANVWEGDHHRAISRAKHLGPAALLARLANLRARLADYVPALGPVRLPVGTSLIQVAG